ncbi:MAG: tetratricopeptide repeat protein [Candidatus Muiribacteriota bacterium]
MKKSLTIILICLFVFLYSVEGETFILENGSLVEGELMEYNRKQEYYLINTYHADGTIDEILELPAEEIEAVLLKQTVTGVKNNIYTNFKHRFKLSKPDQNWYFIEDKYDTKPIIQISRTMDPGADDKKFRLFIYGPYENIPESIFVDDDKFKEYIKDFLIRNFKLYIGFENDIEYFNGIRFYWRFANNFVFTRSGKEVKMQYKQFVTVRDRYIFVMDYCDNEKSFSRETQELENVIETFDYLQEDNIYYDIATIYYMEENYQNSLQFLKKAIKLQPERGELYHKKGHIYGKLGRTDEAIEAFNDALRFGADPVFVNFLLEKTGENSYNGLW